MSVKYALRGHVKEGAINNNHILVRWSIKVLKPLFVALSYKRRSRKYRIQPPISSVMPYKGIQSQNCWSLSRKHFSLSTESPSRLSWPKRLWWKILYTHIGTIRSLSNICSWKTFVSVFCGNKRTGNILILFCNILRAKS